MKTILEEILGKKPETLMESLVEFWEDLTYYYPRRIRDWWWNLKGFIRNIPRYWKILWKDHDFDQGYMEELLLHKLTLMAEYFKTARIAEGEEDVYHQVNLTLRVGEIAFIDDDHKGYVNTQNYKRFFPGVSRDLIEKDAFFKECLRKTKARWIFYQRLAQYSQGWWD